MPGSQLIPQNALAVSMSRTRRWATPVVDSNCRALLPARYTAIGDTEMATESLAEVVRSLTPQEQDAVRQFVDYLKRRPSSLQSESPFLQAADEFIAQHPELLQRLAQ